MLIKRMIHPGFWFLSVDYAGLELCTLAQCLIDLFGYSHMADAINSGKDLHLLLASQVLGMTYDDAKKNKKSPNVKNMRQLAKCFHPDVEVLTRTGWKKVSLLSLGEEVAAVDPKSPTDVRVVWSTPTRLTHRPSPGHLMHLENKGIDLRVTEDHRMVGYSQVGKVEESTPQDFGKFRGWFNAGMATGAKEVDERILRLAVAIQADGSYQGRRVRFGFSKQRKIERLRSLLHEGEYETAVYTNGSCPKNTTMIVLNRELSAQVKALLDPDKTFPWWWLNLTPKLRDVVLDEALHWDSSRSSRRSKTSYDFNSTTLKSLDVLQAIAVTTNRKARLHVSNPGNDVHNKSWKLSVRKKHDSRGGNVSVTKIPYKGEVYCLTVPTDCILVRDAGVVVVTKQCANFGYPGGMAAETFIGYAKSGYGVNISLDQAEELKSAWMTAFPEMKEYFKYIKDQIGLSGEGTIVQFMSGRVRGCCGFCDGCNCVDFETEALTQRGWLRGDEIKKSDRLLTKNADTGKLEWQHPTDIKLFPKYEGPLIEFKSKTFSAVTTPDHRWLVTDKRTQEDRCITSEKLSLWGDHRIHRTGNYSSPKKIHLDDLVELVGWVLTDGSICKPQRKTTTAVRVYQSERANPEKVAQIDDLFTRLGLKVGRRNVKNGGIVWQFTGDIGRWLHETFPERLLTNEFLAELTVDQAQLLVDTMMLGDGHRGGTLTAPLWQFCTHTKEGADAFQYLCVIAGVATNTVCRDMSKYSPQSSKMPNVPKMGSYWYITLLQRNTVQVVRHQVRHFTEKRGMWCPMVPNTYFVARRNGKVYITGNTLFQGRAADGAKDAHYRIAKACYIDRSSPLFGSRPVVFVHDEIITEVPIPTAHEAAYEQARIMIETMEHWCPDVTIKAEPALMTRWRKAAETVFRCPEHGVTDEKCCDRRRLIPWEPCRQCSGKGKVKDIQPTIGEEDIVEVEVEVECPHCKGKCFEWENLPF